MSASACGMEGFAMPRKKKKVIRPHVITYRTDNATMERLREISDRKGLTVCKIVDEIVKAVLDQRIK